MSSLFCLHYVFVNFVKFYPAQISSLMFHKITVPSTENILIWANFLQENRCISIIARFPDSSLHAVEFEFDENVILKPHHVVTLACMIEEYHMFDVKILFKFQPDNKAWSYLKNLKFLEYWNGDIDRCTLNPTDDTTALSLWQIKKDNIDFYAQEAKKYFTNHFLLEKELDPISICLGELFNNVYDHSQPNSTTNLVNAYVLTQFYPRRHELAIAVSDFGIGLPNSIKNYLKSQGHLNVTDEEAINLAFRRGFTTKSRPHNLGLGLNTLKSIVKKLEGRMTLITGNTVYYQKKSGEEIFKHIENRQFAGTTIAIFLDTKLLEEAEIEQTDDEFCL